MDSEKEFLLCKLKFLKLERDSLSELVQSFQATLEKFEEKFKIDASLLIKRSNEVLYLENKELRCQNEDLLNCLNTKQRQVEQEEINTLQTELINAKEKIKSLEKEVAFFKDKDSDLTEKQSHDFSGGKILAMRNNPSCLLSISGSKNNELLSEKVQVLMRSKDLQLERLKQIFNSKSSKFKRSIFALFGFTIEMNVVESDTEQYKLTSIYGENEDFLLFQTQGGKIELLETDFSRTLENKIEAYLLRCNSIPAFLSSVTLDLFSQRTFQG